MDVKTNPDVASKLNFISREKTIFALTLVVVFVALVYAVYKFLPVHADSNPPYVWGFSVDWKGVIRRDTLTFLEGRSPYVEGLGLTPPWAYLLLAPVALLPKPVGAAVIFVLTYAGYAFTLHKMGAKLPTLLAFIACPLIWKNAWNGNIDWIPVIGFVFPPQIGLFLVLIKPQIGIGIALFWLVEAWEKGHLREVIRIFAPVTIAYLISFVAYGFWPLKLVGMTQDAFNSSIFPVGIPIAFALMWYAIKQHKAKFAMSATPFFAPYINLHSYAVTLFALDLRPFQILIVNSLLWIILIFL